MSGEAASDERPWIEHGQLASGSHLDQLATAAQVGILVGLEAAEQLVLPRADGSLAARRKPRDRHEPAVEFGRRRRLQGGRPRRMSSFEIVVDHGWRTTVAHRRRNHADSSTRRWQFDTHADLERVQRRCVASRAEQHPRAALARQPWSASVHRIARRKRQAPSPSPIATGSSKPSSTSEPDQRDATSVCMASSSAASARSSTPNTSSPPRWATT